MPRVFFFSVCFPAARLSLPEWIERSAETEQHCLQPAAVNERPLWSQECGGAVGDSQVEVLRQVVRLQASAGLPLVVFGGHSLFEAAVPVHTLLQTGHDHLSKVLLEPLEILPKGQKKFPLSDVSGQRLCVFVLMRHFTHAVGGVGRL